MSYQFSEKYWKYRNNPEYKERTKVWKRTYYERHKKSRNGAYREMVIGLLKQRDGIMCGICGVEINYNDNLEIDHKKPIAKGGDNKAENLQLSHAVCNNKKGSKLINN